MSARPDPRPESRPPTGRPTHHRLTADGSGLEEALRAALASFPARPRLLGLGEPTHSDETFPMLRNQVFDYLVAHHGYRSIAFESDAERADLLDDYVSGHTDDIEATLRDGFNHGFGSIAANRALLVALRERNAERSPEERIRCYGIDGAADWGTGEAAVPGPAMQRGLAARDVAMADRLDAILAREAERGPTLVFAHNSHLQRTEASMRAGGQEMTWRGAGALVADRHHDAYAVLLTSSGTSPARGVPAAGPDTVEGVLDRLGADRALLTRDQLAAVLAEADRPLLPRTDLTPAMGYGPLDPDDVLDAADGLIHIVRGEAGPRLSEDDLRRLLGELPDVVTDLAGPDTGAPEIAWGDTFCTVQAPGRVNPARMPFATIVTKDYPGSDESSRLDRPDTFALNLGVGRQLFEALLGFPPAAVADGTPIDPAATGILMPHPLYATQGWVRVINPLAAQQVQLTFLAAEAARRQRPRE